MLDSFPDESTYPFFRDIFAIALEPVYYLAFVESANGPRFFVWCKFWAELRPKPMGKADPGGLPPAKHMLSQSESAKAKLLLGGLCRRHQSKRKISRKGDEMEIVNRFLEHLKK